MKAPTMAIHTDPRRPTIRLTRCLFLAFSAPRDARPHLSSQATDSLEIPVGFILLVDDEVSMTRALASAREFRPDLIFLDIVMPDADGGTLAAETEADPTLTGTPIVFLTALVSRHETHGASTQIGGHPFLAKPVDPDIVLAYIEKHAGE